MAGARVRDIEVDRISCLAGDGALVDVVDGGLDAQGRYEIDGYFPDDRVNLRTSSSIWKIQLGVRYEF